MGHWDGFYTKNIFSPRPVPSVFYYWRKYWGNRSAVYSSLITIPFSLTPYKLKGQKKGYIYSSALFILFFPIILFQVIFSWKISSKMLKEGEIVEKLPS